MSPEGGQIDESAQTFRKSLSYSYIRAAPRIPQIEVARGVHEEDSKIHWYHGKAYNNPKVFTVRVAGQLIEDNGPCGQRLGHSVKTTAIDSLAVWPPAQPAPAYCDSL
jgi:hypothetical protein